MKKNKPFFARFLENQHADVHAETVIGGATTKYPSDTDEATKPSVDLLQTHKYPSDGDDFNFPTE
jgi:hypothetical protein